MSELSDNILALRNEGKTYSEIKELLGCSKSTISFHLGAGQKKKNADRRKVSVNAARLYIQQIKTDAVCADCGEDYPYWVLQFDHVRGTKSFTIGTFAASTVDLEKIKQEVDKCDIVCANCHADRTHSRFYE